MTNIVICIGCDAYQHLSTLRGAGTDATRMFRLLTESLLYDRDRSRLLLSPTVQEVRNCLDFLASQPDLEVTTLYFAGHGGVKSGTFYLCFSDADPAKLSTTSLPIVNLFTVVGEIQPRQVNFVIDACQSGGAIFDIAALTKPDVVGQAGSCSIAFLAACMSDQYAEETPAGGIATTALAKYLTGEKQIQSTRQHLDLVEVSLAISRDVGIANPNQVPTAWGLNLYGEGVFALNPHFRARPEADFVIDGIAPRSAAGAHIRNHTELLWEEYRLIVAEHNPERLRATVLRLRAILGRDFPSFVQGFGIALAARANSSEDLFAASDALAVCAVSLLPNLSDKAAALACRELLVARAEVDSQALAELRQQLDANQYALLAPSSSLADLHYLPVRLTKLFAWLSLGRMTASILQAKRETDMQNSDAVLSAVFAHYANSIVAVTDEQASWTYIFARLAELCGWEDRSRAALDRLFVSAVKAGGRFLRIGASGEDAFHYTLARAGISSPISLEKLANPSSMLAVLLLLGRDMAAEWDPKLPSMDGITINTYVPDDYGQFGEPRMRSGNNYTNRIGHGIWSVAHYAAAFQKNVVPHVHAASRNLTTEGTLLCSLAAYLYPDRLPLLV